MQTINIQCAGRRSIRKTLCKTATAGNIGVILREMMRYRLMIVLLLAPLLVHAWERRTEGGVSLQYEAEKTLNENRYRNRLSLSADEEIRLVGNNNPVSFDRSVTSVGLNYGLLDNRLKAGAFYSFIYLWNGDYLYEMRNRFYFNLSYRQPLDRQWQILWRGRLQTTLRDENIGSYRVNPRYTMKNKIEIRYHKLGTPFQPYLSCDLSTNLNDDKTRYDIFRARIQAGTAYRLNLTNTLDIFVRWDEYRTEDDPRRIYLGASYSMKF
ncbi:MAG: DUF2490 domain-containing protein [Dysgonamonadaceae bacterium]|jgi:hypothetical protein|nr:DUF2490 domain-containing protein [Dysgonamonadaceae bacterium]